MSLATWVRFLISAEMLCSASAILRGTESVSAMTLALFILLQCCTLYNFFFLGFRQWLSRADRVVNLNSDSHCFGELELGPWPALAHMCWPLARGQRLK